VTSVPHAVLKAVPHWLFARHVWKMSSRCSIPDEVDIRLNTCTALGSYQNQSEPTLLKENTKGKENHNSRFVYAVVLRIFLVAIVQHLLITRDSLSLSSFAPPFFYFLTLVFSSCTD
jgi:hypothetical protein